MATKRIDIETLNARKPAVSKLKAIEYVERHISISGATRSRIKCLCECGNICYAVVCDFLRSNPISCGCAPRGRKSGGKGRNKRLYQVWYNMHRRVKKSHKYYEDCKICPEWDDYNVFAEWAMSNGYDETKQIDKDIKGNGLLYGPETCSFVTGYINTCNRKVSKKFEYKGELLTLSQIAIRENIPYPRLRSRLIKRTLEQALAMA